VNRWSRVLPYAVAGALLLGSAAVALASVGRTVDVIKGGDAVDASIMRVDEANHLGKKAADVEVQTEAGPQRLSALIDGKPTMLLLAYYSCGHTCPATLRNLLRTKLQARTSDYRVLVLSFDARDNLMTLQHTRDVLGHTPANWTFGLLSEESSRQLTQSLGYRFVYLERDQTFIHPAVLIFLSPQGTVTRYLYGVEPAPRDIELALIESRTATPRLNQIVDIVRSTCFQFDASRSRYVINPLLLFGGAGLGVLAVVGVTVLMYKNTDTRGAT
jgi:protein SCO1